MEQQYRIKEEKTIHEGHGKLVLVTYEIGDGAGAMQEQRAELYQRGNAVAVLLYNKETGTVLLTRQFRLATVYKGNQDGLLIEACAGMVEGDDSPEETARREVMEELGYAVRELQSVATLFMSPGVITEKLHLFIAPYKPEDKQGRGGGLEEEGEHIELLELPYAEAMEMVTRGEIIDAKTVILLQHAGLSGLFG